MGGGRRRKRNRKRGGRWGPARPRNGSCRSVGRRSGSPAPRGGGLREEGLGGRATRGRVGGTLRRSRLPRAAACSSTARRTRFLSRCSGCGGHEPPRCHPQPRGRWRLGRAARGSCRCRRGPLLCWCWRFVLSLPIRLVCCCRAFATSSRSRIAGIRSNC